MDKRTGQAVAIKVIDVENAEDEVEDIIQEISILSELHSPYVTQYHGSFLKGSDLWIIMEFCSGGSCADLLKPGLIPEEYITIIIRELLLGLDYLHGDKKLHRDIKGSLWLQGLYGEDANIVLCSRKRASGGQRSGQACRFWCFRAAVCHDDEEEYLRWNSFLDGARGDKAIRLRPQGRHLVPGDYRIGACPRRTSIFGYTSHEGAFSHTEKSSTNFARRVQ